MESTVEADPTAAAVYKLTKLHPTTRNTDRYPPLMILCSTCKHWVATQLTPEAEFYVRPFVPANKCPKLCKCHKLDASYFTTEVVNTIPTHVQTYEKPDYTPGSIVAASAKDRDMGAPFNPKMR